MYSRSYSSKNIGDGIIGKHGPGEWATKGEKAGAWLRLEWPAKCVIDRIVVYDRSNLEDHAQEIILKFSDGFTVRKGNIPNNGQMCDIQLDSRKVTNSLLINIVKAQAINVGFSEVEVYGVMITQ